MTDQYGIIEVAKEDGRLVAAKGVVEKPTPADAPSTLAIIGRYILEPIVLTILEHQERGARQRNPADRRDGEDHRARPVQRLSASRGGASTAAARSAIWRRTWRTRWSATT